MEKIDFEDLKWGSFTEQFKAYNRQHPTKKMKDLEHFAITILKNPKKYHKTTEQRAKFYLNIILKK
jgi:hypothetical protein